MKIEPVYREVSLPDFDEFLDCPDEPCTDEQLCDHHLNLLREGIGDNT